jgi:hypothetical protein
MSSKKQATVSIAVIAITCIFCVVFFMVRLWHLQQLGQPVNYLAELWAPCSVLSIVIVTFIERMAGPEPKKAKLPAKKRR